LNGLKRIGICGIELLKADNMCDWRTGLKRTGTVLLVASVISPALIPTVFAEPTVTAARIGATPTKTRFVLEVDRQVKFQYFSLANPYRVVIDLPEVSWSFPRRRAQAGGLIKDFRYGLFRAGVSRVVLDVNGPVVVSKSFELSPRGGKSWRVVIDLKRVSRAAFIRGLRPRSVARAAPAGIPPPPVPRARRSTSNVIAIDPGHGGIDPGTTGTNGSLEKHMVLALAREVAKRLRGTGKYRVVLTRKRDVFVPLRERIAIARAAGARLFISLHADSIENRRVRGGSIYTLSEQASDREAGKLAAKENKTDLIAGIDLNVHSAEVANILIDLAQRETMNDAITFAGVLANKLSKSMKLLRTNRRFAGFAVLKAPDVPSVLVELGYLSNRVDEKLLNDLNHRRRVAASMVAAINVYFAGQQAFKSP
jgi:N-acetylmuramoyl-L-alanine amidase